MVKRVAAPAEHYLITQGSSLVAQFGGETLCKFSLQKLLEHRLTNRNLKAGLDFTDAYKTEKALERLTKMVTAKITRDFGFLFNTGVTNYTFFEHTRRYAAMITMNTYYDKSVVRYVRYVQRLLTINQIPINIRVVEHNAVGLDRINITIEQIPSYTLHHINFYKLIFLLPDVFKFIKSLVRKAAYRDEDAKTLTRSRCSGFVGAVNTQRNGGDQNQPQVVTGSATNSGRPAEANRPRTRRTARTQF